MRAWVGLVTLGAAIAAVPACQEEERPPSRFVGSARGGANSIGGTSSSQGGEADDGGSSGSFGSSAGQYRTASVWADKAGRTPATALAAPPLVARQAPVGPSARAEPGESPFPPEGDPPLCVHDATWERPTSSPTVSGDGDDVLQSADSRRAQHRVEAGRRLFRGRSQRHLRAVRYSARGRRRFGVQRRHSRSFRAEAHRDPGPRGARDEPGARAGFRCRGRRARRLRQLRSNALERSGPEPGPARRGGERRRRFVLLQLLHGEHGGSLRDRVGEPAERRALVLRGPRSR